MRITPGRIAIAVAVLYAFGFIQPHSETFRYKLTIRALVDGQMLAASSVIEATQRRGSCLVGPTRCTSSFSAKGVAPMIHVRDGSIIYASLTHQYSHKFPGLNGGTSLGGLPWALYVRDWKKATNISVFGYSLVTLPRETSPLEIQFEGDQLSKHRPSIRVTIPGQEELPRSIPVGPTTISTVMKKNVRLISFSVEQTDAPLNECYETSSPAVIAARKKKAERGIRGPSTFESGPPLFLRMPIVTCPVP